MSFCFAACRTTLTDGSALSEAMIDRRIQMLRVSGLFDNECERLRHIRHREARGQSVGARVALLWALLDESGTHDWESTPDVTRLFDRPMSSFGRDGTGAPRLTDGRSVSLAHGQGLSVAVVTSKGRIGVDIEPCDRPIHHPEAMAERFFSPAERAQWQEWGGDAVSFLRIWTRKEALGKALGQGLARMGELDTALADAQFEEISMEGYIITVCQCN